MKPKQGEVIWSSALAYAVGLITTDGCLSGDGRHIDFTSNDRELIDTFKHCLNLENKVVPKRSGYTKALTSFRIQFGNVTLYRWLCSIGLMPRKSKRLREIVIPDKFFFHFLRGHLDGDGTIKKYLDPVYPKSLRLYVSFLSASLPHLLWIQRKISQFIGEKGSMEEGNRVYRLTFSKAASIKLINHLYRNLEEPYLERKFCIVKEFISMPR